MVSEDGHTLRSCQQFFDTYRSLLLRSGLVLNGEQVFSLAADGDLRVKIEGDVELEIKPFKPYNRSVTFNWQSVRHLRCPFWLTAVLAYHCCAGLQSTECSHSASRHERSGNVWKKMSDNFLMVKKQLNTQDTQGDSQVYYCAFKF